VFEQVEGIVLRAQDYKENERLITLFTPLGILSLIARGIGSKHKSLLALTTPLCHGEYHIQPGRSDLIRLRDGTVLNEHLILRERLDWLRSAGSITQVVLRSQMPGKPAPALFHLYKAYLQHIPKIRHLEALYCSFCLKVLKHEGVFSDTFWEDHLEFKLLTAMEKTQLLHLSQIKKFSELDNTASLSDIFLKFNFNSLMKNALQL